MEEHPANVPPHYEVLEILHEGSTGAVIKARNTLLDEVRVLKMLRAEIVSAPGFRERFASLARELPRLDHPNLVKVFGIHLLEDRSAYLEMEYVEGSDLSRVLGDGDRPSLDESLTLARQSLDALAFLHRNDQVHGMVSPDHLLVSGNGRKHVKLLHTGIVGLAELEDGEILGRSWHYASPEQRIPGRRVSPSSDTYSMGMVLCQLLAEFDPYADDEVANLDALLANGSTELPGALREMLRQAIQEHPDDRFACAASFAEALSEIHDGQRLGGPASHDGAGELDEPTDPAGRIAALRLEAEELVAQSRYREALDRLRAASRLAPDDEGLRDLVGVVREAAVGPLLGDGARDLLTGDHDSAARKIDEALALAPEHERALAMREQLLAASESAEPEPASRGASPPETTVPPRGAIGEPGRVGPGEHPTIESAFTPDRGGESVAPSAEGSAFSVSTPTPRSFMETMRSESPAPASALASASASASASSLERVVAPAPVPPRTASPSGARVSSASSFPWMAGVGLLAVVAAILIWFPEPNASDRSTDSEPGSPAESVPSTQPAAQPSWTSNASGAALPSAEAIERGPDEAGRSLPPVSEEPLPAGEPAAVAESPAASAPSVPLAGTEAREIAPPPLSSQRTEITVEEILADAAPTVGANATADEPIPTTDAAATTDFDDSAVVETIDVAAPAAAPARTPVSLGPPLRFEPTPFDSALAARWNEVAPPEVPIEEPSTVDVPAPPVRSVDRARSATERSPDDGRKGSTPEPGRTGEAEAATLAERQGAAESPVAQPPNTATATEAPSTTTASEGSAKAPEPARPIVSELSSIPSPVVVEPPPLAAEIQEERIRTTLDRFEHAHATVDMGALRAIWPSLQGSQLRAFSESFADAKSMKTKVRDCRYAVERATATASCSVDQTYRPVGGKRNAVEREITFHLRRTGDRWVIDSLGPTP